MENIDRLFTKQIPPWCKRFVKNVGRGINRFRMIGDKEKILLGISGGKDSIAMALALSVRKKWLPIDYSLRAAVIDWKEYPIPPGKRAEMEEYFEKLGIESEFISVHMFSSSFKGKFDCYLCSRNRKRILFDRAAELGIRKIALGHHMDDIVETTLINMSFRGQFATMMPVQKFFGGEMEVIRPLCEVRETEVRKVVERLELPLFHADCPYKSTNIRSVMKPIVRELSRMDKLAREHIYNSHFNIDREYGDFSGIISEPNTLIDP